MGKYRKKPIIIEAFQYNEVITFDKMKELPQWMVDAFYSKELSYRTQTGEPIKGSGKDIKEELFVKTLEGLLHANIGDYIIRGVKGELYPCKPDVFEITYDRIDTIDPDQVPGSDNDDPKLYTLYLVNHSNKKIDICCGLDTDFVIQPDGKRTLYVQDGDFFYIDQVRDATKNKRGRGVKSGSKKV